MMKMDANLNKTAVVDYLCSNYKKFNWERVNIAFDIDMSVGNYKYRIGTNRSNERYLQVIAKGASLGVEVSAKEYKVVADLYDLVWEYVNVVKQDKQWNDILTDLMNH